ncbi:hypothetical protein EYF80_018709 [Liparis tanakae]|uniref:Uncharacterized protein n=1 Tax=Liparis tanakae TaxID=230148 RepID=A0A4Z2HZF2_9TELE|nr:hypothetical protein EYF80_018709 [Liparis tanakae]
MRKPELVIVAAHRQASPAHSGRDTGRLEGVMGRWRTPSVGPHRFWVWADQDESVHSLCSGEVAFLRLMQSG